MSMMKESVRSILLACLLLCSLSKLQAQHSEQSQEPRPIQRGQSVSKNQQVSDDQQLQKLKLTPQVKEGRELLPATKQIPQSAALIGQGTTEQLLAAYGKKYTERIGGAYKDYITSEPGERLIEFEDSISIVLKNVTVDGFLQEAAKPMFQEILRNIAELRRNAQFSKLRVVYELSDSLYDSWYKKPVIAGFLYHNEAYYKWYQKTHFVYEATYHVTVPYKTIDENLWQDVVQFYKEYFNVDVYFKKTDRLFVELEPIMDKLQMGYGNATVAGNENEIKLFNYPLSKLGEFIQEQYKSDVTVGVQAGLDDIYNDIKVNVSIPLNCDLDSLGLILEEQGIALHFISCPLETLYVTEMNWNKNGNGRVEKKELEMKEQLVSVKVEQNKRPSYLNPFR